LGQRKRELVAGQEKARVLDGCLLKMCCGVESLAPVGREVEIVQFDDDQSVMNGVYEV